MQPGERVRLRGDPGRIGVLTGNSREPYPGLVRWQVVFPEGTSWVPEDQLELLSQGPTSPIELLEAGRLGRPIDLRRALTHVRLSGRLANIIYSMDTTGTDFYAYQFKPVLKLLNSPTNGILVADEVGLGKTIESGLIWTELRSRFDLRRLLVLCPAMLRDKWKAELSNRFGVTAEALSAGETLERLEAARRDGPSHGFAILASLQGLRGSEKLHEYLVDHWQDEPIIDLLVVDEAHYLRNPETRSAALGRHLRANSDYVVLLSATPIHLKSDDLFHLLNLVDPDTFGHSEQFDEILRANEPLNRARDLVISGKGTPDGLAGLLQAAARHRLLRDNRQLKALLEASLEREELRSPEGVSRTARRLEGMNLLGHAVSRTRRREVTEWRVVRRAFSEPATMSAEERAFYETVTQVVREYARQFEGHEGFLLVMPQRQMSSSMPAALRAWQSRLQGIGEGLYEDFGLEGAEAEEALGPLVSALAQRSRQLGDYDTLRKGDSKYSLLRRRLTRFLAKHPTDRVVLFSYFRDTLSYLHERLSEDGISCIVLQGGISDKGEILREFASPTGPSLLLSSEVGSEGLDLQFSSLIINYDLPWNPMKVEQRIGRLDRIGQMSPVVNIWNLYYDETIDSRIYERLYMRLGIFERALGGLEAILGDKIRELGQDLLTRFLTPEEEAARIEQTALALANVRREEEELEADAAHLVAYGDYILNEIKAARELGRRITAEDLRAYVLEFFSVYYPGCIFHQAGDSNLDLEVSLSPEAQHHLEQFLAAERLTGVTRLHSVGAREVRCRFENSTIPFRSPGVELISQFHPLIRFISRELTKLDWASRPSAAVLLSPSDSSGIPAGRYAFLVQKWMLSGLQEIERLAYSAALLKVPHALLPASTAELLITAASSKGRDWLGARADRDLAKAARVVETVCLKELNSRYRLEVESELLQNEDRADLQQRSLERHFDTQQERLARILSDHVDRGRTALAKATEGRIRALEARVERQRIQIAERRRFRHRSEDTCAGLIVVGIEA